MKLEHLSLVLGLTKNELKRRLELGQIDPQFLNKQVSEYSQELKLDALCDSWVELRNVEQFDRYDKQLQTNESIIKQ
ncbi:hypothetical protein CIK05_13075 [Bdellovibrio sp. qaytius]|nr:hypothetical protein CIK05_13075 [Bdellovibrio sp. qaytius]